ncbi:Putative inner membrane protein [hydrothermal vent metagenome]|uniref:Inner membrane protein n=1 Tax=hydrothermal vent metagenome TaxID=652676 RepID=A0A3B0Y7U0_9ZZZZ
MNIIKWFGQLRTRYILKYHPISSNLWKRVIRKAGLLHDLSAVEEAGLRELATLLLYKKAITGAHEFQVSDEMAVAIAAQAALPILELGLDYYNGWVEIIVYPGAFQVNHEGIDQNGLISNESRVLSGEAWLRGPIILSWDEIERDLESQHPGHNVVVHEFAHKLDMLNGRANGMPPLHPSMEIKQWTQTLSMAFEILQDKVAHQFPIRINAYAATTPAEYFAVISEYFFTAPDILELHCAEVYRQLTKFYRQDPLMRQQRNRLV